MILKPTEPIIKPKLGGKSCYIKEKKIPDVGGSSCTIKGNPMRRGTSCTLDDKTKPQLPRVVNPTYSCKFSCEPGITVLPEPIPSDLEYNPYFMEVALREAWKAFNAKEVPVGAVFVRGGKIVLRVHNLTNEERNATRHCEILAADVILRDFRHIKNLRDLEGFVIYVTCEPCVMCASALRMCKIRKVFFGCHNDKFGGLGSVFSIHKQPAADTSDTHSFTVHGGIMEKRCVDVLRTFYERGNPKLPPSKRHRRTKASTRRLRENFKKYSSFQDIRERLGVGDLNSPESGQAEHEKKQYNKDNKRQRECMTKLREISSSVCEQRKPLDKKAKINGTQMIQNSQEARK